MQIPQSKPQEQGTPNVIAVGGGKGGVGKTCVAVNLAVEVARRGWRTVLVDADLGCANIEAVLGLKAQHRLDDFFSRAGHTPLEQLLTPSSFEHLQVLAGTSGIQRFAQPRPEERTALFVGLHTLAVDLIIVDVDAGSHPTTLDFFLLSRPHGIAVITPERTSIDNAFKFLRAVLFRRIEKFYGGPEVGALLRRHETLDAFLIALERWSGIPDEVRENLIEEILAIARAFRPRVVVNKVNNAYEAKIAANILAKYTRQHLRVDPEPLAHLSFDKAVGEAVNSGVPFVSSRPRLSVSGCIGDMANRLGYF